MVDRMGFEPICCPVCQTGGHPKQPHSPYLMVSAAGLEPARVSPLASEARAFTNFATRTYNGTQDGT